MWSKRLIKKKVLQRQSVSTVVQASQSATWTLLRHGDPEAIFRQFACCASWQWSLYLCMKESVKEEKGSLVKWLIVVPSTFLRSAKIVLMKYCVDHNMVSVGVLIKYFQYPLAFSTKLIFSLTNSFPSPHQSRKCLGESRRPHLSAAGRSPSEIVAL